MFAREKRGTLVFRCWRQSGSAPECLTSRAAALRIFDGMCTRWEGVSERGQEKGRRSTGFNPRANERYDNNIYRRRRRRWRRRGVDAGSGQAGRNVDVRYIYFGRNTAAMMSSSIFKRLPMWLRPRDSSFGIPCVQKPLSSLAVVVVSSSRCRQLLSRPRRAAPWRTAWNSHDLEKKADISDDCTRNTYIFLLAFVWLK